MLVFRRLAGVLVVGLALATPVIAQNPVQWQASPAAAIQRAKETRLPLMFWVTQRHDIGDDDSLEDAQEEAFRDPAVVGLAQKHFIPVRVAINSRNQEEAQKLGLPTTHGLFIALVTPDGKLIEQIDPGQVADPGALAKRLSAASRRYLDDLYTTELAPAIRSRESSKADARRAVQTVWRLGILSADKDCVALRDRADLTPGEKGRLMNMLAGMATPACVEALLARAATGDLDAANALGRAEPGALATLLNELPTPESAEPTARQLAAYRAAARIARDPAPKPDSFWTGAPADQRGRVLEALSKRAETLLEVWTERNGR